MFFYKQGRKWGNLLHSISYAKRLEMGLNIDYK